MSPVTRMATPTRRRHERGRAPLTPVLAVLACTVLAGCNALPAAGPTASAIADGSEVVTAQGTFARYEIVDVDAAVVAILAQRRPDSLLATFGDHRPSLETVIGIGDSVAVQIWEAGSGGLFSGPLLADRFSAGSKSALIPEQVVARDGAITVPYAGRIPVAGRRTQDVQALIETELSGKAIQPQVLVSVTKAVSQAVTVTGEGAAGARIPLSGKGDRILDVVASAGGVRTAVNETFVRLSRGKATSTVPMEAIVANPRENVYLRPGDVLTLVRDPQTFLAVGALGNATEIPYGTQAFSLAQALARARGLSDLSADPEGLFVFRFEPAALVRRLRPGSPLLGTPVVPVVYRLNLRDPNGLFLEQAFQIRNRDLVYASNAPFTEVQKVLGLFSAVAGPVTAAATTYAYTR